MILTLFFAEAKTLNARLSREREGRRAGAFCYNRRMKDFQEISVWDFVAKPTDLIKNNWMLIAAGTREKKRERRPKSAFPFFHAEAAGISA